MKSPFDFKAAKELSKIVKENNVQIIHSNYLRENYIAVLSKLFGNKAKIVYTCHFNTYDSKIITMFNKIFYKKLRADYLRYYGETVSEEAFEEKKKICLNSYEEAFLIFEEYLYIFLQKLQMI